MESWGVLVFTEWHRHKQPVGIIPSWYDWKFQRFVAEHICVLVLTATFKDKKTGFEYRFQGQKTTSLCSCIQKPMYISILATSPLQMKQKSVCRTFTVVLQTLYLFTHPATVSQLCDVVIFRFTIIKIVLRCSPTFLRESVYLLLSWFHPGDTVYHVDWELLVKTEMLVFSDTQWAAQSSSVGTKGSSEEGEFSVTASIQSTAGGSTPTERARPFRR